MTYGEIIDSIKAYNNRKQAELKDRALMDYVLAQNIGINVAHVLNTENKIVGITEVYPFLFKEENKKIQEEKIKAEVEINKQRMIDYANYINSKRKEGK